MPGFDLTFADTTPAPAAPIAIQFDDTPADAEQRQTLWAGRPTTTDAIKRVAAENKVSPQTIMELGTTGGQIESRLAKSVGGQLLLEGGEGLKRIAETVTASGARFMGRNDLAAKVHADRRQRDEFLNFIEKGGDTSQVLGERGNRVYNSIVSSVAQASSLGIAVGPTGVYSHIVGDSWEQGLDEAQQLGLSGNDSIAHAGRKAVIEGGITYLMGRFFGNSLEETFSPAYRNAAKRTLENPETKSLMKRLASELGGMTAEGAEELMTAGGHQLNEMSAGMRKGFSASVDPSKFETKLSDADEAKFKTWKAQYAPKDSGRDYDLRGAYKAGLTPDPKTGHWPDTFKKPNHPTFSNESQYAKSRPDMAGRWEGETFIPPEPGGFDWAAILEAGLGGVAGRGAAGAIKKLTSHLGKIESQLPDITKGTRDAGIDIERGINPFAVRNVDDAELDKQIGRATPNKTYRDSYREAVEFYVQEARKNGEVGGLTKLENDVRKLREEERQQEARRQQHKAKAKANKGKAGESTVSTEPVEVPIQTENERAEFSYNDFLARIQPAAETVVTPEQNINPYILAPWESETKHERRIRQLSKQVREHKETIKGLRETTKANKQLREDQLLSAQQLIQENVPREEQFKFINRMRTAKNPSSINRLLDAVDKHIDRRNHNLAKRELAAALGKASNLRAEFADQVGQIKSGVDFKAFNGAEAAQKLRALADENPNIILSDADRKNLARLEAVNVNDMSADDIRDLATHVQDLTYQSAIKDRLIGHQESASLQDTADTAAQEANAAPRLEMASDSWASRIRRSLGKDNPEDSTTRTNASMMGGEWTERPEATLHAHPTLRRLVYDDVMEAGDKYQLQMKAVADEMGGLLQQLGLAQDGSAAVSVRKAVTGNSGTVHDAWRDQKRKIGGVEITRGEADAILWQLRDPQNFRDMLGTEVKLEAGERTLSPLTPTMIAQLTDFSGPESNALIDYAFQYGNGPLIDAVNDTNEALTGRVLTERKDAVPRSIKGDDDYVQLISKGRNGLQNGLIDSYGGLKHRQGGSYQFTVPAGMDFLDMFMAHVSRMQRFATHAIPARNAEAVLNHPDVKQSYVAKNGEQGYEQIADAVKQQVVGTPTISAGAKRIQAWNSTVAGAHVAAKLSVLAAQSLDPLVAASFDENGMGDLKSGYAEMADRDLNELQAEMDAGLSNHSGEYWLRYKSDEVASAQSHGQIRRQGYFRVPHVAQLAMHPVAAAENRLASLPNYLAAKAAARRQFGLAPNDYAAHWDDPAWSQFVAKAWNQKTLRGSTSSHPLELSGALRFVRKNPLAGLVLTFMNNSKNIYSMASVAETERRQGRYGRSGQLLATLAASTVGFAALQEALSFEQKEPFFQGVAKRIVSNLATLFPVVGSLADNAILRPLLGQRQFGNDVLLAEVLTDTAAQALTVADAITGLGSKEVDQEKFNEALGNTAANSAALLGLPGPAAKDWAKRLKSGQLLPGLEPIKEKARKGKNPYTAAL